MKAFPAAVAAAVAAVPAHSIASTAFASVRFILFLTRGMKIYIYISFEINTMDYKIIPYLIFHPPIFI